MSKQKEPAAPANAAQPIEQEKQVVPAEDPNPNPTPEPTASTSQALFPDLMPQSEPPKDEEPAPAPDLPAEPAEPSSPEEKPIEPQAEPEEPLAPAGDAVDLDELLKKLNLDPSKVRIRTKVTGEESDVPLDELKKGYQTDQALTKRGQKIGEERKKLEEIREELQRKISQPPARVPGESEEPATDPAEEGSLRQLREEIRQLREIVPILKPMIYQSARQKVADELKAEGFDDFMDLIPKIDARVAQVESPDQWRYYNTPEGAKALYFKIKAEEMRAQIAKPPTPPIAAKPNGAPILERPRPPVVKIANGSGPGSGAVDDWNMKYQEAFTRWKASGKQEDFDALMKLKGVA